MRELAVQAQNGSNGTTDRANLDTEYQQLSQEITRIAAQTKFNGKAIIGASAGAQVFQVGANNGDTLTITTDARSTTVAGDLTDRARNASTAVDRARHRARHDQHEPRHLRRRDQPLRLRDLEPADHAARTSRPRAAGSWTPTSRPKRRTCRGRQILQQAGTAMVAQANQLPQTVLTLLR